MAAEYSTKYVFIMATVVLQVPDESLVSKVKNACKMLVGVTTVRVQKSTPKVDDITKTAHYKEAMDDVKNGRVYHANSVDDVQEGFKENRRDLFHVLQNSKIT